MNVIEMEGVSQRYGYTTVLHQLNLSLGEGEVLGLFGHNGAGAAPLSRAKCRKVSRPLICG